MPDPEFVMVKLANGAHKRLLADHPAVTAEGVTVLKREATLPNGDPEPDKLPADLSPAGTQTSAKTAANTSETGTASANKKEA